MDIVKQLFRNDPLMRENEFEKDYINAEKNFLFQEAAAAMPRGHPVYPKRPERAGSTVYEAGQGLSSSQSMRGYPHRNRHGPPSIYKEATAGYVWREKDGEAYPEPPGEEARPVLPIKPKKKAIWGTLVTNVLYFVGILILVVCVIAYSQGKSADTSFLGIHFYNVLTGSMQSEIPQGSFVITKETDPATIKVGDDITFYKDETTTITHRVIEVLPNYNDSGQPGFKTKGVENEFADEDISYAANVVGVVKFHIPQLGYIFRYISENIIFTGIFFALVVAMLVVVRMFFTARKKEQEYLLQQQKKNER